MAIDDVYELAYREAVRALDHQTTTVAELRSRASALIATASITVSLLGPETFSAPPFGWLAIMSFVLLSVAVLAVVWPRIDWRFAADPRDLIAAHVATGDDDTRSEPMVLEVIAHMADDRRKNAAHLAWIARAFRLAAGLLVLQILSTIAAVSVGV